VKQLAFDLADRARPTFENFVVGRNAELVQCLRELAPIPEAERSVYLWGAPGSGRTHLLHATLARLERRGLRAGYFAGDVTVPNGSDELDVAAIDDVELLNESQSAVFNLYNDLRERGGIVLAAGNAPPAQLRLRADLVTRLAWGLVYEVHVLSDDEKTHALTQYAATRGFDLPSEIMRHLLTRMQRDMRTLIAVVDALDRYSLEMKKPVTLSLLREMLESGT
jgi:DnaA family protein